MFKPHPGKQTEFLQSTANRILYGGARGGGKTLCGGAKIAFTPTDWHYEAFGREVKEEVYKETPSGRREVVVDKVNVDHQDFLGLIIRRTYPQLQKNVKPETDSLYLPYGAQWNEQKHQYTFPSGARIILAHCNDAKALLDFVGGNYNVMVVDEANQFHPGWIEKLYGSLRTSNPNINPQMIMTANPGEVGHNYLKRTFVDKCKPTIIRKDYSEEFDVYYNVTQTAKPYIDEEGISYQYIPATVFDNRSILDNDKQYVRALKKMSETMRAMWLEGNWDVMVGSFFDNWDTFRHTVPEKDFVWKKDFSKETHLLYRAYDYGTKSPFVCLFIAVDKMGKAIVFDEIIRTGMASSHQVKYINEYTKTKYGLEPEDFTMEIADPGYWQKHSEKDGIPYSPSQFYSDNGIYLTRGINDRIAGAALVYEALSIPEDGIPKLKYRTNCEYSIETIPALPTSQTKRNDVDTNADDHSYDAVRYFFSIITPFAAGQHEIKAKQKDWREEMQEKAEGSNSGNLWAAV